MKTALVIALILLLIGEVAAFISFKMFIKLHRNETIDNVNKRGLLHRAVVMIVLSIFIGIIEIIIQFV